jgi:hypothetical protein
MKRIFLLAIVLLSFVGMTSHAAAEDCPLVDDSITPDFTYDAPEGVPNFEPFVPQITDYLNAGGSADALPEYFAGVEEGAAMMLVAMGSEVFRANMDDDESDELLIDVSIVHTGFWGGGILLYDCINGAYELLGRADIEGWAWGDQGFTVFDIDDKTGDGQPEVYVQRNDGIRIAGYAALTWDGSEFLPLQWFTPFADDPLTENYSNGMGFSDLDEDGVVEASLYFHYDARERDYAYYDLYQIRNEAFHYLCQIYLGDEAFLGGPGYNFLIETLEEADSYFRCGYDDVAEPLFRQVLEDESLEEVPTGNFGDLRERGNLRAFSLYRLVLLYARQGDMDSAADAYAQIQEQFPVEVPGSQYTSMAEAFWLDYEQSADWEAACDTLAEYLEPTISAILEDDDRWTYALYLSSVAGYPGQRPNSLYRDCSAEIAAD